MLDFGCGCGRFIRHFRALSDVVEIHGTDIDPEMIEWNRRNLPFANFTAGPHEPPLPYEDTSFDLVINHSVFTHLDERYQDLWLEELRRVTAPGAVLLLTVEGLRSWNVTYEAGERAGDDVEGWRDELETRGILFISDDQLIGSTHPDFYHSTVHAPWYVFEHWTKYFDLVSYLVDGSQTQDMVILRRRPDDAPQPRPIGRRLVNEPRSERQMPVEGTDVDPPERMYADLSRELKMLRVGLAEQGKRISVLGAELRDEIASLAQLTTDRTPVREPSNWRRDLLDSHPVVARVYRGLKRQLTRR